MQTCCMISRHRSSADLQTTFQNNIVKCFVATKGQLPISSTARGCQEHCAKATGYKVKVSRDSRMRTIPLTASATGTIRFRHAHSDKAIWRSMSLAVCRPFMYPAMKFRSDTRRRLSIILIKRLESGSSQQKTIPEISPFQR